MVLKCFSLKGSKYEELSNRKTLIYTIARGYTKKNAYPDLDNTSLIKMASLKN